ncbi:hypothetical protein [Fervidobacterium thailandense]|uniref:hypothetical protein n=1 Tax=Fervidobacterium thailandense TaxID=1008305 RepID=UPI001F4E7585|nr:hypothetical protein [Fervidobacterium thailandense]
MDPRKYREEKEAEIRRTYGEMRKRSFRFLFLNIMIVLLVFTFMFFVQRVSPQTYSNIVESLQLVVELSKVEYLAPDPIFAKVYIVNTGRRDKDFILSDFYIKLYSENKTVFEFSYPRAINSNVTGLGKRLVYELGKDVTLSNLEAGEYKIFVSCKINGREVRTERLFKYQERIDYIILSEPYYLVGERFTPSLLIVNRTKDRQKIEVVRVVWDFLGEKFQEDKAETFSLEPGGSALFSSKASFLVREKGEHEIGCTVYLSDGSVKVFKALVPVTSKHEEKLDNLEMNLEADDVVVVNKLARIRVNLINKLNRNRFLKIDRVTISIVDIGYSFVASSRRVFLPPFGKSTLIQPERLIFTSPGVYEMIVTVQSGDDKIIKKLSVAVGK